MHTSTLCDAISKSAIISIVDKHVGFHFSCFICGGIDGNERLLPKDFTRVLSELNPHVYQYTPTNERLYLPKSPSV